MICLQPRGTPRAGVCGLQTADPQPAGRECGLHIFDLQIDHVLTEHVCILFVDGLPVRLKGILVSFILQFLFLALERSITWKDSALEWPGMYRVGPSTKLTHTDVYKMLDQAYTTCETILRFLRFSASTAQTAGRPGLPQSRNIAAVFHVLAMCFVDCLLNVHEHSCKEQTTSCASKLRSTPVRYRHLQSQC